MKIIEDVTNIWWKDWLRIEAIVLIDNKFYYGCNHQWAMTEYMSDYWSSRDYDLEIDSDMEEAINYTDELFRQGKINGFDLFEGGDKRYLISHYPNILKNEKIMAQIKKFVSENNYAFGSFMNENKLDDECVLIEI